MAQLRRSCMAHGAVVGGPEFFELFTKGRLTGERGATYKPHTGGDVAHQQRTSDFRSSRL
jgi:hypothetical protein